MIHSFGYRAGPPPEWNTATPDVVEDVRALSNPYKLAEFHDLSGLDAPVREFVLTQPQAKQILDRAEARILALIGLLSQPILRAGFGCTGGKDRSVERHPDGGVTRASVLLRIAENGRRER